MRPDPGALVTAAEARDALFGAVSPALDAIASRLPAEAAAFRPVVLLQLHPVVVRLILVRESGAPIEAARLFGPEEVPGAPELAAAIERFVVAGLSEMPDGVVAGAFQTAAPHGAGFAVLLDPQTVSARCVVMPQGADMAGAVELFGIASEELKAETVN